MASQPPMQQYPPQPLNPYYLPPANPIAGPAKIFGIIYACFAGLAVLGALTMFAIGGAAMFAPNRSSEALPAAGMGIFFLAICVFVLIIATLEAVTAYGLLTRKPWGRTLLIVTSILSLISIPVGTILGGLALYFFMRAGAEQDYARLTLGQP